MKIPGFTATAVLQKSIGAQRSEMIDLAGNKIVLQDCPWYKNLGCTLGPFSWCALASLGGASPYWDCVAKASGGNCLDCLTGNDPRDNQPERSKDGYAGVNEKGKFVDYKSQGLTSSGGVTVLPPSRTRNSSIDGQLNEINKRLTGIERCACGPTELIYNTSLLSSTPIPREAYVPPGLPIPPSPYFIL